MGDGSPVIISLITLLKFLCVADRLFGMVTIFWYYPIHARRKRYLVNINLESLSWISRNKRDFLSKLTFRESNSDPTSSLHVVVPLFLDFDGFPVDKGYYLVIVEF